LLYKLIWRLGNCNFCSKGPLITCMCPFGAFKTISLSESDSFLFWTYNFIKISTSAVVVEIRKSYPKITNGNNITYIDFPK
jgi:hypothetical protein